MATISIDIPDDIEGIVTPAIGRDPGKAAEWLRAGFEVRFREFYDQWQALNLSTSRFAELMGLNLWQLDELLSNRGLKRTNLPGH